MQELIGTRRIRTLGHGWAAVLTSLLLAATCLVALGAAPASAATGQVSGRVTGASTAGLRVTLVSYQYTPRGPLPTTYGPVRVAADGTYRVTGLAPGEYHVRVVDTTGGVATTWAPDRREVVEGTHAPAGSRSVTLRSGASVTGMDVRMRPAVVATGVVRDAAGAPAPGVRVIFADREWTLPSVEAVTDAQGRYHTGVLPEGNLVVQMDKHASPYRETYHPKMDERAAAVAVPVADADIALDLEILPGAGVRGSVVEHGASTGPAWVGVHRLVGTGEEAEWVQAGSSMVGADGTWQVRSLKPGAYRIMLGGDRLHDSVWGAETRSGRLADGKDVALAAGTDVTGVDVVGELKPFVRGRVLTAAGAPEAGVSVHLTEASGESVGISATTDASGRFTAYGLKASRYVASAFSYDGSVPHQWFDGQDSMHRARPFAVAEGANDVTLRLAAAARASGTVPAAQLTGGGGLAAYRLMSNGAWEWYGSVEVAKNGRWSTPLLAGKYRFVFRGDAEHWVGGGTSLESATTFAFAPGQVRTGIGVPHALKRVKAPKVTGKAKVGRTLTASKGTWRPGKVTVKYRWQVRRGAETVTVRGATRAKLKLTKKFKGRKVRVRVTVSKPGYRTAVVTSPWSRRVA